MEIEQGCTLSKEWESVSLQVRLKGTVEYRQ